MKKTLFTVLIGLCISLFFGQTAAGQANKKILFIAADLLRGVGKNGLNVGSGLNARFQYPLTATLALTGKVGIEGYKIKYSYYMPGYSGVNYTYYTGKLWFYSIPGSSYQSEAWGASIPVTIGPRLYLPSLRNGLHIDLNAGADIAASRTMRTSLHLSPGVGYAMPLANGRFLDVTGYYISALERGSSIVGVSVAYGLPVKF